MTHGNRTLRERDNTGKDGLSEKAMQKKHPRFIVISSQVHTHP